MGFKQFILIIWARRWMFLVPIVCTVAATSALVFILPPRYEATATVLIQGGQPDPVTGEQQNIQSQRVDIKTELALIGSNLIALDVVRQLNLATLPDFQDAFRKKANGQGSIEQFVAGELLDHLKAGVVAAGGDDTNEIGVTFSSPNPVFSAAVANAFVDAFLKRNLEFKTGPALRDAQWFSSRNVDMRRSLEQARAKLTAFQERNGLVGRTDEVDAENARLKSMSDQITDLRRDIAASQSILLQINGSWPAGSPAPIDAPPAGLANDTLAKLQQSLADTEVQVAQLSGALGPNNDHVRAMVNSQTALRKLIETNLVNTRAVLEGRLAGLKQQEKLLEDGYAAQAIKVLKEQSLRDQLDVLVKDVDQQQQLYNGAMARAASLKLEGERSSMNVTPVDAAFPADQPVFPKKVLMILASLILGIILGLVLALLREAFDRRVRVAADLEAVIDAPMLGVLLPT